MSERATKLGVLALCLAGLAMPIMAHAQTGGATIPSMNCSDMSDANCRSNSNKSSDDDAAGSEATDTTQDGDTGSLRSSAGRMGGSANTAGERESGQDASTRSASDGDSDGDSDAGSQSASDGSDNDGDASGDASASSSSGDASDSGKSGGSKCGC